MMKKTKAADLIPQGSKIIQYNSLITYEVCVENIIHTCEELYGEGFPLKTITVFDDRVREGFFTLMYVFSVPEEHVFLAPTIKVLKDFPSLTPSIHQASIHERKIFSFFGLVPTGHPNLRPLILHEHWPKESFPLRKDFKWNERITTETGTFEFHKVQGEGIYEIPVGPVHAGIIEPGHFRFSVAGEEILHLEPRLGYSHKGVEKLFEVLPLADKIKLSERISGDSSFSHSLAFCQAMECLGSISIPRRAQYLRSLYCELERMANHIGDIGAIMLDTGFNFGGAHCMRLREIVMQLHEQLSGSRFLRGINTVGGIKKNISDEVLQGVQQKLQELKKDFMEVIVVAQKSSSLIERLKDTGRLDTKIAKDHGVLGVTAKALGVTRDARIDHPYAAYSELQISIPSYHSGDVYSRFLVRIDEVYSSFDMIEKILNDIPNSPLYIDSSEILLRASAYAVSIVEGWRGDIVYVVATDEKGDVSRADVRDPSFLNWTVLGHAGKGNMVPDFPLINKSFNLSYSGNDV